MLNAPGTQISCMSLTLPPFVGALRIAFFLVDKDGEILRMITILTGQSVLGDRQWTLLSLPAPPA